MSAERPRVRAGDSWRFESINRLTGARFEETRTVLEVADATIVTRHASADPAGLPGRFVWTRDWNLLTRPALGSDPDAGVWQWKPYYPHFRFPLREGARRTGSATVENAETGTRNLHRYATVVLPGKRVAVPAGEFEALPVRYEADVESDDGQQRLRWRTVETLYFAPRAGWFVRYEGRVLGPDGRTNRDSELRLLAFSRG